MIERAPTRPFGVDKQICVALIDSKPNAGFKALVERGQSVLRLQWHIMDLLADLAKLFPRLFALELFIRGLPIALDHDMGHNVARVAHNPRNDRMVQVDLHPQV